MPRRNRPGRGRGAASGTAAAPVSTAAAPATVASSQWFDTVFGAGASTAEAAAAGAAAEAVPDAPVEDDAGGGGRGRRDTTPATLATSASAPLVPAAAAGGPAPGIPGSVFSPGGATTDGDELTDADDGGGGGGGGDGDNDDDDGDEESVEPDPAFDRAYFRAKLYETELRNAPLREWPAARVAAFVRGLARFEPKYAVFWEKISELVDAKGMDGALLSAVDKRYMLDELRASGTLGKKGGGTRALVTLQTMFEALEPQKAGSDHAHYWDKLCLSGDEDCEAIAQEYADSPLLPHLVSLLHPLRRAQVKYLHVDYAPNLSVKSIDEFVAKRALPEDDGVVCKVVSASTQEEPWIVKMNLLYFRHPQKRRWQLLTSVDFAQHGAAEPGHWHLNRTSEGGFIAHSGMGDTAGSWHGDPECTPLWWFCIPKGTRHLEVPHRFAQLVGTAAGGDGGAGGASSGGGGDSDSDEE